MSKIRVKSLVVGMVGTNCYLVYDEETKRAVVVDPGDAADLIDAECRKLGLKPEAVLLTHGHFDHMMAAPELKKKWEVPVYAAAEERALLMDGSLNMTYDYYRKSITLEPDVEIREGDRLELAGFEWLVLETPGHTSGSCCYYIEKEEVLFSGDTLFQMSYGRVDFPTGSARDMASSVKRLLTELPDGVMVYPGHMEATSIGFEKKNNPLARY